MGSRSLAALNLTGGMTIWLLHLQHIVAWAVHEQEVASSAAFKHCT